MKVHGLTTVDDFSKEWSMKQYERELKRAAAKADIELKEVIADAVYGRIMNGR